MKKFNNNEVLNYVKDNIGIFHQKRIDKLNKLNLSLILKKKNPYLFRAKHLLTSEKIVIGLVDAFISSGEETIFGDWLEGLAIFINQNAYNGRKSGIKGIDLEFDLDGERNIISIKSGPNWANSSQISKMKTDFKEAAKTLRTSNSNLKIKAVNGCCYGKDNNPDKGDYFKYCGQEFWEYISGKTDLYIKIIEPLGYKAKEKNEQFLEDYSCVINKLSKDFSNTFCDNNGKILWDKLVQFNSGKSNVSSST